MRERLIDRLAKDAVRFGEFTLASGKKSDVYIDTKQVTLSAEGHFLVGHTFFEMLNTVEKECEHHDACGGMSMGADPLCSSLSLISFQNDRNLDAIYVRKASKTHGTQEFLEGTYAPKKNARVVLLEDVVTSGGSSLLAIERLRAKGYVVDRALALVDREAGGRSRLAEEGVMLNALCTLSELKKRAP